MVEINFRKGQSFTYRKKDFGRAEQKKRLQLESMIGGRACRTPDLPAAPQKRGGTL
jgi:hypothetical protein